MINFAPTSTNLMSKFFNMHKHPYNFSKSSDERNSFLIKENIFYYLLRCYGMNYDDFNYEKVNKVLALGLKYYIKYSVSTPQMVNREKYEFDQGEFSVKDKLFINILAAETKRKAVCVFLAKAIADDF